jgi:hypothetical protein
MQAQKSERQAQKEPAVVDRFVFWRIASYFAA